MSGTINAPSGDLRNPLLQQTESALEARLKPETRADYMKIVVAGLHIALAGGPNGFLAKLHASNDPIGLCAKGAAQLVLVMSKEAKGTMPRQAMVPAGLTLMLHGLDFIDRAGVKIGANELARATTQYGNELFHRQGITPEMLKNATAKVHSIVQDPDAMAKINLKAGITQHPDAAKLTPIPGMPPP